MQSKDSEVGTGHLGPTRQKITKNGIKKLVKSFVSLRGFPGGLLVKTQCISSAEGTGLIPGRGTKIPRAKQQGQK